MPHQHQVHNAMLRQHQVSDTMHINSKSQIPKGLWYLVTSASIPRYYNDLQQLAMSAPVYDDFSPQYHDWRHVSCTRKRTNRPLQLLMTWLWIDFEQWHHHLKQRKPAKPKLLDRFNGCLAAQNFNRRIKSLISTPKWQKTPLKHPKLWYMLLQAPKRPSTQSNKNPERHKPFSK